MVKETADSDAVRDLIRAVQLWKRNALNCSTYPTVLPLVG